MVSGLSSIKLQISATSHPMMVHPITTLSKIIRGNFFFELTKAIIEGSIYRLKPVIAMSIPKYLCDENIAHNSFQRFWTAVFKSLQAWFACVNGGMLCHRFNRHGCVGIDVGPGDGLGNALIVKLNTDRFSGCVANWGSKNFINWRDDHHGF